MVKRYNPRTASLRHTVLQSNDELTRVNDTRATVKPEKCLLRPKKRISGRNNYGRVTCRHRGGGHKRKYRVIDFRRQKDGIQAKVVSIEYDPNRSAHIALLNYLDGEKSYIIAPKGLKSGMFVSSGKGSSFDIGCSMKLKDMPIGSFVHNVENNPGRGGRTARSAGSYVQLMSREGGFAVMKFPSGEIKRVNEECRATFGVVSNAENSLRVEGKAGRKRWKGIRPTVRGTAMNPVDHPHGGGEGRQNSYLPRTPWGQYTKGMKTRSKKKSNKMIVQSRKRRR